MPEFKKKQLQIYIMYVYVSVFEGGFENFSAYQRNSSKEIFDIWSILGSGLSQELSAPSCKGRTMFLRAFLKNNKFSIRINLVNETNYLF